MSAEEFRVSITKNYIGSINIIKNDPVEDVAEALHWHFEKEGIKLDKGPALTDLVPVQAERCKTLAEICQMSTYFYTDSIEYDEAAVKNI